MVYRICRTAEADIGMRYYLSHYDGTGGRLKTEPRDFVVREISSPPPHAEDGRFTIARVTSTNWETNRLVGLLSRELGCSRERIGFAGTKDKRAVTTQLMSFECAPEELSRIDLRDVVIEEPYRAKRGMRIGDLLGNEFEISIRGCDMPASEIPGTLESVASDIARAGGFPNYFGVQRFGVVRPVTHIVGERIVRGDLEGAVRAYVSEPSEKESPDIIGARAAAADTEDYASVIGDVPKGMSFEKIMMEHLISHPGDHAGAIGAMPPNLQMMFVHAYQSYLFNLMLSERMSRGMPLDAPVPGDVVIPADSDGTPQHERPIIATEKNMDLVARQVRMGRAFVTITLFGSASSIPEGEMGDIERSVIEREGIRNEDFIVPDLPRCSSKGSRREILCPVRDLRYSADGDGYTVAFSLTKGNYATCLMREFMKSEMHSY